MTMEQAVDAAGAQAKAYSTFTEKTLGRFRADLDKEVQKQLSTIRAEGTQAAAAVAVAATNAKAQASIATAASSRTPPVPGIDLSKERTGFRRAFESAHAVRKQPPTDSSLAAAACASP